MLFLSSVCSLYCFLVNQYDDNTTIEVNTDREYLISISNIPILKRQAVFMEYTALNDNKPHTPCRFPLSGVSSFQIVDDTFLCIFQNNLYIGELGKVQVKISVLHEATLTFFQIGSTINTFIYSKYHRYH